MYHHKLLLQRLNRARIAEIIILGVFILLAAILLLNSQKLLTKSEIGNSTHQTKTEPSFGIASTNQNCTATVTNQDQTTAQQFLTELNQYRTQHGASPVVLSPSLMTAAKWFANDKTNGAPAGSTDSLGRSIQQRLTDCGYAAQSTLTELAENECDIPNMSPSQIITNWEKESGPNQNMLNPDFKVIGVANVGQYWILDLGSYDDSSQSPTNSPTISPTTSPSVTPQPTAQITPSPTITQSPNEVTLSLSIKIPGIGPGGNLKPLSLTRAVVISIFNTQNQQVKQVSAPLNFDGNNFTGTIDAGAIPTGTYYIKLKTSNTLQKLVEPQLNYLKQGTTTTIPNQIMIPGDLNDDNQLNIMDYNMFLSCIQNTGCQDETAADLNDDGKIDIIDYNLLLSGFAQLIGD